MKRKAIIEADLPLMARIRGGGESVCGSALGRLSQGLLSEPDFSSGLLPSTAFIFQLSGCELILLLQETVVPEEFPCIKRLLSQ